MGVHPGALADVHDGLGQELTGLALSARALANRAARDASQWPIQVLTSGGQQLFPQTSIDWDSGRVTLRVAQAPRPGEAKEIRISSIVRASARIPFEFYDLPMP